MPAAGPGAAPALLPPAPRSEKLLKVATSIPRDNLVSLGTCFGKFTKSQKFRLSVMALDFLAPYAKVGRGPPSQPPAPQRALQPLTALGLSCSTRCG